MFEVFGTDLRPPTLKTSKTQSTDPQSQTLNAELTLSDVQDKFVPAL